MKVQLDGKSEKDYKVLTWNFIKPNIPELEGKMITSVDLGIVAGEVAKAIITYRSKDEIMKEHKVTLLLTSLSLDFDSKILEKEVKWLDGYLSKDN